MSDYSTVTILGFIFINVLIIFWTFKSIVDLIPKIITERNHIVKNIFKIAVYIVISNLLAILSPEKLGQYSILSFYIAISFLIAINSIQSFSNKLALGNLLIKSRYVFQESYLVYIIIPVCLWAIIHNYILLNSQPGISQLYKDFDYRIEYIG